MSTNATLRLRSVEGFRDRKQFIRLPWSIYAGDPNWVPPIRAERHLHLSARNPYFDHARWRAWIAYRGTSPVGRISAQIDDLRLETHADATGSFGMLEAEDDPEIFALLLRAAETWLHEQGMQHIEGPYSLSINDECGLLIDGFDTPPSIMMGHAHRYYAAHLEACGFGKANDLIAYRMHPDFVITPTMKKIIQRSNRIRKGQFTLRPLARDRLRSEIELLRDIFNDAWCENWGFVPFTTAEFQEVGTLMKSLVDKDFVQIGEVDNEPMAFIVALPNLYEVIHDLNGRLLPVGWLKLLWRAKVKYPNSARVALMGVRREYQRGLTGTGISLAMIEAIKHALLRCDMNEVEMGWVLEENKSMRSIIESIGGKLAKRYRIYRKALGTEEIK